MLLTWLKQLKIITNTPIFIYLLFFLSVISILDYSRFKKNLTDQTMNRLKISINYLSDFSADKKQYDTFKLGQCVYYHKKVVDFFEFERPPAYAMMGFCYDLLGESDKATKAYQAAVAINPNDFWPLYNLGIGAYRKGNYKQAVSYFQHALDKNPEVNAYIFYKSKIYTDIRLSAPKGDAYDFFKNIRQGREKAYIFLMESLAKMGNYSKLLEVAMLGLREHVGNDGLFYYYAGRATFHEALYARSVDLLQVAATKAPNNADVFVYLSMCMKVAGKDALAQSFLETAKRVELEQGSLLKSYLNSGVRFF